MGSKPHAQKRPEERTLAQRTALVFDLYGASVTVVPARRL
jgi:hypothetical protein